MTRTAIKLHHTLAIEMVVKQEPVAIAEHQNPINKELESRLKKVSAIIGWILIVLSLLNLTGYATGINWMAPPFIGILSMKITASVSFLLSGIALVLRQSSKRQIRTISSFCGGAIIALEMLIFCIYFRGLNWIPLNFISSVQLSETSLSIQMISPAVAVLFLSGGLGILFIEKGKQDLPAFFVCISGSLGFFTRLFGIRIFHEDYGLGYIPNTGMDTYLSFLPCLMLAMLGFGILFANPGRSLFGLLCSTTRGGYIVRRIMPLAIIIPMFWAAATTAGEFAHWYNLPIRWTLFINGTIVSFCLLSCQIAKRLDTIDHSRIVMAEKRADVVYSLAHDLKVPLIGATQSLDLLLKEALGALQPQQRSLLSVLRESMDDQLWMIDNLVYEFKTEQGSETITIHMCIVDKLLDDCLEKIGPALLAKSLEVKVNHESLNAAISADSVALRRVINNLLHNALKHCPRNGEIRVNSRATDKIYEFYVWNSGPVIPDTQKQFLFERFWQSEDGHNRNIGNGLGLYICRQIVEAHGGAITCLSEQEQGTSFIVTLPRMGGTAETPRFYDGGKFLD